MKRSLKAILGILGVSVLATGCEFNPANNDVVSKYGPAPDIVDEKSDSEYNPEDDVIIVDYGVEPTYKPYDEVEPSFDPEYDNDIADEYGPYPDLDEDDSDLEFNDNIVMKYGPMPE